MHEWLSLATLALVGLHGVSLLGDAYLHPGLSGIAVPFASAYRPFWTGIGIIAGYGLAALGLSYYLRNRIGAARWKRLHRLTAAFWLAALVHTIGAGTDAGQGWFLVVVAGALVIPAVTLLGFRLLARALHSSTIAPADRQPVSQPQWQWILAPLDPVAARSAGTYRPITPIMESAFVQRRIGATEVLMVLINPDWHLPHQRTSFPSRVGA